MIEFTIPLNLPVRAVVATELNEPPPEWLSQEMIRRALRHHERSPNTQELPTTQTSILATEVEDERALLRTQQKLFAEAVRELRHATKLLEQRLEGLVHEFQEATVELAHTISAKLIFEEVDEGRFPIANLVHEVVARLDMTANAIVRLHPDDLSLIQESQLIGDPDGEHSVRFVADSNLARGDCKAKSGEISVVYELRRQIEEMRRLLLSTVNGHAEN